VSDQLVKKSFLACYQGKYIDWGTFEDHVAQVRLAFFSVHVAQQNELSKVLNLCEDRYHFLVVFTASMLAGRTTIMPANRSDGELARLTSIHNDAQLINDPVIVGICQTSRVTSSDRVSWEIGLVPDSMIVAELYTSGSTGEPVAHSKTWGQLVSSTQKVCARFGLNRTIQTSIIATVPPQHMFGFEMSIVLPLVCGVNVHHDQPFYPLDIQRAMGEMPPPRIVVTTPAHLKACVTTQNDWQDIERVISATSSLSEDVARQVERVMKTKVEEVYGCSEIGAIATRRVTNNQNWEPLPGYTLEVIDEVVQFQSPAMPKPVSLPDRLEVLSDGSFKLVGRLADMVKIGGKRGSLAELTERIKELPGVEDAIVFKREYKEGQRERLASLVVVRGVSAEQLRVQLSKQIDPVFMPRWLYIMAALPYTATGKLPRGNLLAVLENRIAEEKTC